ncbi:SPX domain-containing protein [Dipodascopsis uninucleata]
MKFSKQFQLQLANAPADWAATAVQYKILKKSLNSVVRELSDIGLERETIQFLNHYEQENGKKLVEYDIKNEDNANEHPAPRLKITIDLLLGLLNDLSFGTNGNVIITKQISPANEDIVVADVENRELEDHVQSSEGTSVPPSTIQSLQKLIARYQDRIGSQNTKVEIPFKAQESFFDALLEELDSIDSLLLTYEESLTSTITDISDRLAAVTTPLRTKSDIAQWRSIFRTYTDLDVYLSCKDISETLDETTVSRVNERLAEFLREIESSRIVYQFKNRDSLDIFSEFCRLNISIIRALNYLSLNRTASSKILKKFDKRTALAARDLVTSKSQVFVKSVSMSRLICYIMAKNLISLIPQIEDYSCPVCLSIVFKPIRVKCGHVFCLTCLTKMQRMMRSSCPLCREHVILRADTSNIDVGLANHLLFYFPIECKEKRVEDAREQMMEIISPHRSKHCAIA